MSRIGKLSIEIPEGVSVNIADNVIQVEGKLGKLEQNFSKLVSITQENSQISVAVSKAAEKDKKAKEQWGLVRSLVANMVTGVSKGFTTTLEVVGVGYKVSLKDRILTMYLGYSHDIKILIPQNIELKCPNQTSIEVFGFDKQIVGQFCAKVRSLRKPEPYKGKGVRIKGETILRKEGKKK
jgi:large subunit ribosomal protein L6